METPTTDKVNGLLKRRSGSVTSSSSEDDDSDPEFRRNIEDHMREENPLVDMRETKVNGNGFYSDVPVREGVSTP